MPLCCKNVQQKHFSLKPSIESPALKPCLRDAVSITAPRAPPKRDADPRRAAKAAAVAAEQMSHSENDGSISGDSGSELSQALTELSMAGSQTRFDAAF